MTRLFIHIGTWKTGSSTIQYNLYKVRSKLEQEGYFYLCKEDKMVVNDGIIRNFTDIEKAYVQQSREKLKKILKDIRDQNSNVDFLSSAEEFSGNPFKGFKNAKAVAKNLYEITKNLDLDVYIIVYLRRQDDFFESLYQQSIRLGESHEFHDFLKQFDETDFNWYSLVKAYSDVFGKDKIIVRRYDKKYLSTKNSLVQDFGKVIGSQIVSNYEVTTSRNKGYSRDTLEITRIMNKYFDAEERFQLRKLYDEVTPRLPFERYSYFTPPEREAFLNKYIKSNRTVLQEFIKDGGENLFPQPTYQEGESVYQGLTIESLVENFSKALLVIKTQSEKRNKKLEKEFRNRFFRYRLRKKIVKLLNRFPWLNSGLKKFIKMIS